jgi:hypothetical protein
MLLRSFMIIIILFFFFRFVFHHNLLILPPTQSYIVNLGLKLRFQFCIEIETLIQRKTNNNNENKKGFIFKIQFCNFIKKLKYSIN